MATNATVKDALDIARSLLGDDMGLQWSDPVLFPKVKQAHKEMVSKLILNGVAVEIKDSGRLTITAGSTSMGNQQPTDLIRVVSIRECDPSDPASRSIPMTKHDNIPNLELSDTLRYWAYNQETVQFLGSNKDRDVLINYIRQPQDPTEVNSLLDFNLSEIFIGPRVAALAIFTKDKALFQMANQMAEENLSRLVRTQVKGDQNLPVRRRPFSFANRRGRYTS